ncbi:hypothetical protein EDD16DRAFT_1776202 [Pisolithus croceorrhizus]|nr:hypothetical protein EV401DRAFT_1895396 [Pisolithus croceorrhizus]KAI6123240.1 hypothetical protein EDD16DRAFT_1776202 [Pisolithus croceorrhizus]
MSSTIPFLMTKATSVSSVASAIAPAYRETTVPAVIAFPQSEDEGDVQDPAVEDVDSTPVAGHHQPHKAVEHTTSTNVNPSTSDDDFDRPISDVVAQMGSKHRCEGYNNSRYVTTSNADDMDDVRSNTGSGMTVKAPCVTAMTNVIVEKPAKKPCTSLCGDAVAEGSGHLAPATMIMGQASSTGTNSMGSGHICYINGHLPHSLQEDRKWTKLMLPTLVTWAGSLGDPWVIPDQDLMRALQIIVITVNLNFGNSASQHLAQQFWLISLHQTLMMHRPLMFKKLADLDPLKLENAYRSQFLLQLLAHMHLWPCIGCLDVLRLNTDSLKAHGVRGVLSLCCVALKCVIHLFQRGKLHIDDQLSSHGKATVRTPLKLNKPSGREMSTALSFSKQNWGACTCQYFMSVNKCNNTALKEIVISASTFITPTMDSLMAEDGTSPNDMLTDDFLVSANQHMSIYVQVKCKLQKSGQLPQWEAMIV